MTNIKELLMAKFPNNVEREAGRLVFLDQMEIKKLDSPILQSITKLNFYKALFYTGYIKFKYIDVVIGLSNDKEIYLLTNPVYSDKDSNLVGKFEEISIASIDKTLISEIIKLYRETGVEILNISSHKYQIMFGKEKWRVLQFELKDNLKIKTVSEKSYLKILWIKLCSVFYQK